MTKQEIITRIKDELGGRIVDWHDKSERRILVEVKPDDVPPATRLLFVKLGARFQTASGTDTPAAMEIVYHWAFDAHDVVLNLLTKLDRDNPVIESVASICTGIEWIEREMWELLGITFKGHPDMRHLLLMDDWPEGKHPLRRDFRGLDE